MGTRGSALNQEEWRVIRFVDGEFGKTAPPISVIPGLEPGIHGPAGGGGVDPRVKPGQARG
ncbi:hypothetical protein AMC78_CH00587 [Rhizobium phaseoli]|nr:hypothetical protein AMC78_CH00587 [Rhizobium phaseoli]